MFYRHVWNQDEMERCYQEAYSNNNYQNNRFGGLLLPFLGGLLIGGLVVPKVSNGGQPYSPYPAYPPYQYPQYYPVYPQPIPYTYPEN
jgi:hypothetical protein